MLGDQRISGLQGLESWTHVVFSYDKGYNRVLQTRYCCSQYHEGICWTNTVETPWSILGFIVYEVACSMEGSYWLGMNPSVRDEHNAALIVSGSCPT